MLNRAEIIDMLRQQNHAGCTDVLADAPVNHYDVSMTAPAPHMPEIQAAEMQEAPQNDMPSFTPRAIPATPPLAKAQPITPPAEADEAAARALAQAADSLDALKSAMDGFDGCALKNTAKNLVFSDGLASAKIMLVGEAPGQDEDRQGKPLVGRAGQFMDAMLGAIGVSRTENLYMANVVPWRPPGNRTPSLEEIALCKPFIQRHIELVQPDILLLVGNISNKALLETTTGITKLRGQWQDYEMGAKTIKALPLLHPAYILRRPETKADMWADLCALKKQVLNA